MKGVAGCGRGWAAKQLGTRTRGDARRQEQEASFTATALSTAQEVQELQDERAAHLVNITPVLLEGWWKSAHLRAGWH
jgi:hypothetical protein